MLGIAGFDYAGLRHLQPQIVAFTGALPYAGAHGESAVLFGDVIDQLHDDDGLAYARAAEKADLATLQEWLDQVDDLHAGFEHFRGGGLLVEQRSRAMDGMAFFESDGAEIVHGFANYVHDAAESAVANGNGNRATLIDGLHATHHAVSSGHSDAADAAFAEMLLHFDDDINRLRDGKAVADDAKRLVNRRHIGFDELHVHSGPGDLNYVSDIFWHETSVISTWQLAFGTWSFKPSCCAAT